MLLEREVFSLDIKRHIWHFKGKIQFLQET